MSLAHVGASAAPAPISLTVDELEAKLNALHDYLSTPYRARAENILQQRRRREQERASPALAAPLRIINATTAVEESNEAPQQQQATMAHTITSAALSHSTYGCSSAEQTLFAHDIAPAASPHMKQDDVLRRQRESSPSVEWSGADKDSGAAMTQRRIQQLEWQVKMLADTLQTERDRFTQLQEQVVLPLQAMMEESLRRQVELEWEVSQLKGKPVVGK